MVFQHVATEELELFNSAIQTVSCQGAPAYEEAEADALATSPRPGLLVKYHLQLHTNVHTNQACNQVNTKMGVIPFEDSICESNVSKKG